MQKAPVMQGSGLQAPIEDSKPAGEVHVFGKNLEDRVVTNEEEATPSISFDTNPSEKNPTDEDIDTIRKRKFDAITGEEDEETIFQGEFKLFIWDLASSNWIEKGRGQLKLNDSMKGDSVRSRLIMRVSGTLKIVLNVAIKKSYFRVIAHSKTNIRFTDSQHVWAASGSNANQLRELIEDRLQGMPDEEERPSTDEEEDSKKRPKPEDEAEDKEESSSKRSKPESKSAQLSESSSESEGTKTPAQADSVDDNQPEKEPEDEIRGQSSSSDNSQQEEEPESDTKCTSQSKEPTDEDEGRSSESVDATADDKTPDESAHEENSQEASKQNEEKSESSTGEEIDSNGKTESEEQSSRAR